MSTTPKAMREVFDRMPRSRVALETGMHSPWVSRVLSEWRQEVIVAHARNVRLIGLAKSYGERLRGCNVCNMDPEKAEGLRPELQAALELLPAALKSLSEQIAEYNERIEQMAEKSYPQVALLKQIKGVGTLIALTFLLTLEDPHRFRKSSEAIPCVQPGKNVRKGTFLSRLRQRCENLIEERDAWELGYSASSAETYPPPRYLQTVCPDEPLPQRLTVRLRRAS